MRSRRLTVVTFVLALLTGAIALTGPASAAPGHTVVPLHFTVHVGPTGNEECSVIGDLYVPDGASADNRMPAILTTNGFGGSKDSEAVLAAAYADRGYVVLSYSGLGFGGSGCRITLDDPEYDGKAARQLIDYLSGAEGIAFTDAERTVPAPALDIVRLDAPGDPRIGMVGGSYGGAIQFATAATDQRVDAIVPIATWNDLSYSLSPNNLEPDDAQDPTVGAAKLFWALGFTLVGLGTGFAELPTDPGRMIGCPNFAQFICPALVTAGVTGFIDPGTESNLKARSSTSYGSTITAPTLVVQGQSDTLFNLNEGIANYQMLEAAGVETKMIWTNGGHSGATAPGELDFGAANPEDSYVGARIATWFDRYLKDMDVDTGPEFAYFRDWVEYTGSAAPAFATGNSIDVGTPTEFFLSGSELTTDESALATAASTFLVAPAGLPTSIDPVDALGGLFAPVGSLPELELPGTFAAFTTPALEEDLDVVGQPVLDLTVSAPAAAAAQAVGPAGQLVLFIKLSEVAADGTTTLVRDLVAPVRVPDAGAPFTVRMPAIVHRFDEGNQLKLTVSGGSSNYRGGLIPTPVTISTGSTDQVLTLPTTSAPIVAPPAIDPPEVVEPPVVEPTLPTGPVGAGESELTPVAGPTQTLNGGTAVVGEDTPHLPNTGTGPQVAVLLLAMLLVAGGCVLLRRPDQLRRLVV